MRSFSNIMLNFANNLHLLVDSIRKILGVYLALINAIEHNKAFTLTFI